LPDNFFSIPFADLIRSKKINFPQKKSERFFCWTFERDLWCFGGKLDNQWQRLRLNLTKKKFFFRNQNKFFGGNGRNDNEEGPTSPLRAN
jgi:hypothetical protein